VNEKEKIAQLDKYYPPCGPCMLCGHHDKRHRMWDVWLDCPDSDETMAWWYKVDVEYVKLVREIRPYK